MICWAVHTANLFGVNILCGPYWTVTIKALSVELWKACRPKHDSGCLPWDFWWHCRWGRVHQEIFAVLKSYTEYHSSESQLMGGRVNGRSPGRGWRVWLSHSVNVCVSLPAAFHMAAVRSGTLTVHHSIENMTFCSLSLTFLLLKLVGREPGPQTGQMQVDLWSEAACLMLLVMLSSA